MRKLVAGIILPTGAGAAIGAERALEEALADAGLQRDGIDAIVTTGYCPFSVCNEQKYGCRGGMYAARGRGRGPGRSGPWQTAPAGSRPRPTMPHKRVANP